MCQSFNQSRILLFSVQKLLIGGKAYYGTKTQLYWTSWRSCCYVGFSFMMYFSIAKQHPYKQTCLIYQKGSAKLKPYNRSLYINFFPFNKEISSVFQCEEACIWTKTAWCIRKTAPHWNVTTEILLYQPFLST